jgi:hypothetical protein
MIAFVSLLTSRLPWVSKGVDLADAPSRVMWEDARVMWEDF